MHLLKFILPVLCLGILQAVSAALKWENLPDLPAGAGMEKQIGVAGATLLTVCLLARIKPW